jgi:hypothetical protein
LAGSDEPDAVASQRRQLLIQMKYGAAKTINLPDGHTIELPLGGISHEPIQSGPNGDRPNGDRRIFTQAAMHEWFGEPGLAP